MIQVVYNSMRFIPTVFPAALQQTEPDVAFYAVIAANDDGGKEFIQEHYPSVHIVDPGYNVGFSRGHNEIFSRVDAEFYQLVNPDLILTPSYVENLLKVFEAEKNIGGCCGKLLRFDFDNQATTGTIDSTGVVVCKSGRGFDRGQHEEDRGQYATPGQVLAISGAAAMYRRQALQDIITHSNSGREAYFDEDFHSYWEDVDLSWRMLNAGWHNWYEPSAVAYHGRSVPSSPGGYRKFFSFMRHRRSISSEVRQLNYRNHAFLFVKNSPRWYLKFFVREMFYNLYVLLFETSTLRALPELLKSLPGMLEKRRILKDSRKIQVEEIEALMQD